MRLVRARAGADIRDRARIAERRPDCGLPPWIRAPRRGVGPPDLVVAGQSTGTVYICRSSWQRAYATASVSTWSWRFRNNPTGSSYHISRRRSADCEQVDHEHERLMGLDHPARTARPVRHGAGNRQPAAAADAHPGDALVPARNDLPLSELELERPAAVPRCVELVAA